MNPLLGLAIYMLLWWLSFFVALPIGATSPHEAGEASEPGVERGAPKQHNLGKKALIAAAIAAVLWPLVALLIVKDVVGVFPH
jgi:predicted secreted protein